MSADVALISKCGLFCGECRQFKIGKCGGCGKNEKATWCGVRKCCVENNYQSCADCKTFANPNDCKKFNNFFTRFFRWVYGSNAAGSIDFIKKNGYEAYATEMRKLVKHTVQKR